jgi:hypothetical protein
MGNLLSRQMGIHGQSLDVQTDVHL